MVVIDWFIITSPRTWLVHLRILSILGLSAESAIFLFRIEVPIAAARLNRIHILETLDIRGRSYFFFATLNLSAIFFALHTKRGKKLLSRIMFIWRILEPSIESIGNQIYLENDLPLRQKKSLAIIHNYWRFT